MPCQQRHDDHIQHQCADAQHRYVAPYFKDLEWDRQTGRNHGQPLRPRFATPQPNAFHEKEERVQQRADADADDLMGCETSRPSHKMLNRILLARDRESIDPILHEHCNFWPKQLKCGQGNDNECQCLTELEYGDKTKHQRELSGREYVASDAAS